MTLTIPGPVPTAPEPREAALRQAAAGLETQFLAMMLESAGLGRPPGGFAGGPGEEQFASFLVREQAKAMTRAGGIGLAEMIYEALKGTGDGGK